MQLSVRTYKWMKSLQDLEETVGGDLYCSVLEEFAGGFGGCRLLGRGYRWRSRVQLSVRTLRWRQLLKVLSGTVGGDLCYNGLPKPSGRNRGCRFWQRLWPEVCDVVF